jgi:hypothetical protein
MSNRNAIVRHEGSYSYFENKLEEFEQSELNMNLNENENTSNQGISAGDNMKHNANEGANKVQQGAHDTQESLPNEDDKPFTTKAGETLQDGWEKAKQSVSSIGEKIHDGLVGEALGTNMGNMSYSSTTRSDESIINGNKDKD